MFPCTIGRGGIRRDKREGDGATPAGLHRVVAMLYRADRLPPPAGWAVPIGPRDGWSDDPADPRYNRIVLLPRPFSHERLRRSDRLYDLVLVTDWNAHPPERGRGSAIFLHRWRRPGHPTAGCIGLRPDDLLWIARRLRPGARLLVPEGIGPSD